MGKLKRILLGEKMPDRNDPKYRERYERDVEAGRRFARATGLDRLAGHVQRFAEAHRGLFLAAVMAVVLGCLAVNAVHFAQACRLRRDRRELKDTVKDAQKGRTTTTIPQEYGTDKED